jgi:hypothetical protein
MQGSGMLDGVFGISWVLPWVIWVVFSWIRMFKDSFGIGITREVLILELVMTGNPNIEIHMIEIPLMDGISCRGSWKVAPLSRGVSTGFNPVDQCRGFRPIPWRLSADS